MSYRSPHVLGVRRGWLYLGEGVVQDGIHQLGLARDVAVAGVRPHAQGRASERMVSAQANTTTPNSAS